MNLPDEKLHESAALLSALRGELSRKLIGQDDVVDHVLIGLLCNAHVLLEGVPGLGKTLLAKTLGKTFDGQFKRIQFTPDLMPSDVIGHTFFDAGRNEFVTRQGPVFAQLVLADEINRAPAKTQSALLEAMQEQQVTLEGRPIPLPRPFMVMATQNPVEQEGTYPLPEAQLDRFLLKIRIDYPEPHHEIELTRQVTELRSGATLSVDDVQTLLKPEAVVELQHASANVTVDERVMEYAVAITRATRDTPGFSRGAGPRGSIALVRAGRAKALMAGRSYVVPDDIKAVAIPALRHRVAIAAEAEIEGLSVDGLIATLLENVPAPRT
ncbi:MAG TPA: MoxR family ATPase [Gallionellaceae bacterium]|nr:MoxR family ATPase [Gallionellaceae bacterium]